MRTNKDKMKPVVLRNKFTGEETTFNSRNDAMDHMQVGFRTMYRFLNGDKCRSVDRIWELVSK